MNNLLKNAKGSFLPVFQEQPFCSAVMPPDNRAWLCTHMHANVKTFGQEQGLVGLLVVLHWWPSTGIVEMLFGHQCQ